MKQTLDERYGRARRRRGDRRVAIVAFVVLGLAVGALVVFGSFKMSNAPSFETTGYTITDDSDVQVRYTVSMPAGKTAACAVEALSESYATVGWKIVEIEASDSRMRRFATDLRTTAPPTTGHVKECWYPSS